MPNGKLEPADLGCGQGVFVGVGGGEGAGGVKLDEFVFEHASCISA
jgi:hypothetical protein